MAGSIALLTMVVILSFAFVAASVSVVTRSRSPVLPLSGGYLSITDVT